MGFNSPFKELILLSGAKFKYLGLNTDIPKLWARRNQGQIKFM